MNSFSLQLRSHRRQPDGRTDAALRRAHLTFWKAAAGPLISTRLQPGGKGHGGPEPLQRFAPDRKPLKRLAAARPAHTRLKPGANERGKAVAQSSRPARRAAFIAVFCLWAGLAVRAALASTDSADSADFALDLRRFTTPASPFADSAEFFIDLRPPSLTLAPAGQTAVAGTNVSFAVGATGAAPLFYQWRRSGLNLPAQTNAALTLSNVRRTDEGAYAVAVSNAFSGVTSGEAVLRVLAAQRLAVSLTAGRVQLRFRDDEGGLAPPADAGRLEVQASSNLVQWTPAPGGILASNGWLLFEELSLTNQPRRFYRVLER